MRSVHCPWAPHNVWAAEMCPGSRSGRACRWSRFRRRLAKACALEMNSRAVGSKSFGSVGHLSCIATLDAVTCMLSLLSGNPVDGRTCVLNSNPLFSSLECGLCPSLSSRRCAKNWREISKARSVSSCGNPCPTTMKNPSVDAASHRARATSSSGPLTSTTVTAAAPSAAKSAAPSPLTANPRSNSTSINRASRGKGFPPATAVIRLRHLLPPRKPFPSSGALLRHPRVSRGEV
mmetsp:Transcript_27698/g.90609  ORF Transcript_27698/g.90609 Transcript_27698/m.90609 type:complete len:234 (-) Transcript_27698:80-781(-)